MDGFAGPVYGCACGFYKFIRKHVGYVGHLEETMNALKEEKEKLDEIRIDIEERLRSAEYRQKQPLAQVSGWLQRVHEWKCRVDVLIVQGETEIQQKCFFASCPKNFFASYKVAKEVNLELSKIDSLKDDFRLFEVVTSITVPRATLNEMPLGNIVGLDEKVEEVWNCLIDPSIKIIGLYGMGGIGKTTLMKRINNKLAKEEQGFGVVIWIVVSKDLNIDMVQNDLGKKLVVYDDDQWRQKNRIDKASDIFKFLKEKRFVLLLDDLWQGLDLTEVGIPLLDEQNNYPKILFTTRQKDVCRFMNARILIKIDSLQWEDSWVLFKSMVGEEILGSHPQICELAVELAKHCGGLPLSLITVGRTMASKHTRQEWEHAITTLKSAASEFSSMEENVLSTLKFSYDNLSNEVMKQCFLYCSLFPEDYEIYYSTELIPLWIGEGFFDQCESVYDAENLGHDIIGRLKLACLLENANRDRNGFVKMHDVIRNMGLWISTNYGKNKNKILVGNRRMEKVPATARWKEAQRISFESCGIKAVDITPDCPNLLTLRICRNAKLIKISDTFFQHMPSLKVLDLSWNRRLTKLPRSLFELSSALKFLNLSYTAIEEMPVELKNLRKLKYLRLRGMQKLKFPLNVISSLSLLVRLDLYDIGSASSSDGALLDELESLLDLQSLGLTVGSEAALQKFLSSEKLQGVTRELYIKEMRGLSSLKLSLLLRNKRLRVIGIKDCNDLEEVVTFNQSSEKEQMMNKTSSVTSALDKINTVLLRSHDSSTCFSNLSWLTIANNRALKNLESIGNIPSLENLYIFNCPALEEIMKGDHQVDNAFSGLKDLRLWNLPKLRSICKKSLPFPLLERINVRNCPNLRKLPLDEVAKSPNMNKLRLIMGESVWLKKLLWDDEYTPSLLSPYFCEHQLMKPGSFN